MIKSKKRKKQTRLRGSHTQGGGFKKKQRGSGHRGGVGNAGTGKRADQKKYRPDLYFGKSKTLRKGQIKKSLILINLDQIQSSFSEEKAINLTGYKILSDGELSKSIKITASAASKKAIEKVKKAGGEIVLLKKEIQKENKSELIKDKNSDKK